ncbi:MAG: hypothetical protein HY910_06315 [Desulfarculus sp.]|nr:hypothetical protein [Desulfarculus sp.]
MAEIKSSIQIAMERAAALGAGGGHDEQAREEGKRQGRALGRRAAGGELDPQALAGRLAALPEDQRPSARQAAAAALVEDMGDDWQARLAALAALAAGTAAERTVVELARVLAMEERLADDLHQELAQELTAALAAQGIGGSAVRANPASHPQLKERYEQAVAACEPRRLAALEAVRQALQAD